MPHDLRAILFALTFAVGAPVLAQRVELPHGTGTLQPQAEWVVLRSAELALAERSSDPTGEPAKSQLRALTRVLSEGPRTGEHVVLHMPGPVPGTARTVNAYSAVARAAGTDLLRPTTVAAMTAAFRAEYGKAPGTLTTLGHEDVGLFATPALRLRFELNQEGLRTMLWHVTVPSGDRVQYFECAYDGRDADAPRAFEELLRSFDGARDAAPSLLPMMLIGGALGGLAGVLAGRWRKRRTLAASAR